MIMIYIKTEEGHLIDMEDSRKYIIWKIKDEFSTITEFRNCMEINKSSYWGDCVLKDTEDQYSIWINNIADLILKE